MTGVTLRGVEGNTAGFKNPGYVQAVNFIANRKGKHGKIGERPLRLKAYGR